MAENNPVQTITEEHQLLALLAVSSTTTIYNQDITVTHIM